MYMRTYMHLCKSERPVQIQGSWLSAMKLSGGHHYSLQVSSLGVGEKDPKRYEERKAEREEDEKR
jgi:hypothetical protein